MTEREQNRSRTAHLGSAASFPINCGLVKNIAWRTLINPDTVTEREIQVLAASVISYIRETEVIEPRPLMT